MTNHVKIAFSGIGAVGGGYYGGLMAARFQQNDNICIYFIAKGKNLQVIKKNGLQIDTPTQKILATPNLVTDQPKEIGVVDFLFCSTKSYDLCENIQQLLPIIGSQTIIIPLLNGADITETIQQILPRQEIWKGCVYIGARLKSPGHIFKYIEKDRLFFGSQEGNQKKQRQLLSLLLKAGINAFNPSDIDERIWKKFFLISTAATITSYYDMPMGEIIRQHKDQFIVLGKELQQVTKAKGISLPEDIAITSVEERGMMPDNATTSMHSDFMRGGKTELETLTGYVVRLAKELGIETPLYNTMYNSLKNKS